MDDDFLPLNDPEDEEEDSNAQGTGPLPPPTPPGGDAFRDEHGRPWFVEGDPPYDDDTFLRAVEGAMASLNAFLLLNHEKPDAIVARLGELARVVKAATTHKSKLRPKAIRLGLRLEPSYWIASGRFKEGLDFFEMLYPCARDENDAQLWGEVLMAWGRYQFLLQYRALGRFTLEWALEKIEKTDRADLRLLARAEIFNAQVLDLSPEKATAQAAELLKEADKLQMSYVKGRVYYALSRRYQYVSDSARAFEYAQQALCYFYSSTAPETLELTAQALGHMYTNLVPPSEDKYSPHSYAERLLATWERVVERTVNPWHRAAVLHAQARQLYLQGHYPRATYLIKRAWRVYCRLSDKFGKAQMRHMLGLVHIKQGKWDCATHYLRRAQAHYEALGETIYALHARHAADYMLVERAERESNRQTAQMYLRAAEKRLLSTRQAIEERVTDPEARRHILQLVDEDIATVKRRLACGGHNGAKQSAA